MDRPSHKLVLEVPRLYSTAQRVTQTAKSAIQVIIARKEISFLASLENIAQLDHLKAKIAMLVIIARSINCWTER